LCAVPADQRRWLPAAAAARDARVSLRLIVSRVPRFVFAHAPRVPFRLSRVVSDGVSLVAVSVGFVFVFFSSAHPRAPPLRLVPPRRYPLTPAVLTERLDLRLRLPGVTCSMRLAAPSGLVAAASLASHVVVGISTLRSMWLRSPSSSRRRLCGRGTRSRLAGRPRRTLRTRTTPGRPCTAWPSCSSRGT